MGIGISIGYGVRPLLSINSLLASRKLEFLETGINYELSAGK